MALDPALIEDPYELQKLLGMRIVDWSTDYACWELPITAKLGNRYGIPHGGVYAALLDTVMGFAGCYTGDAGARRMAMTLNLNVSYLSRPKGALLIAEGRRVGGGKSTFFGEGVIVDETGEKIATGTGTFRYRKGA